MLVMCTHTHTAACSSVRTSTARNIGAGERTLARRDWRYVPAGRGWQPLTSETARSPCYSTTYRGYGRVVRVSPPYPHKSIASRERACLQCVSCEPHRSSRTTTRADSWREAHCDDGASAKRNAVKERAADRRNKASARRCARDRSGLVVAWNSSNTQTGIRVRSLSHVDLRRTLHNKSQKFQRISIYFPFPASVLTYHLSGKQLASAWRFHAQRSRTPFQNSEIRLNY